MERSELEQYLKDYLAVERFKDYCPNGLQVEGRNTIQKIVTGVTASQALIDRAIAEDADAVLVHHGFFWKGESPVVRGMKRKRLQALLSNNINLFAYHLPLDAHGSIGNNVMLAKVLGIQHAEGHKVDGVPNLVWTGDLPEPQDSAQFSQHIATHLNRFPLVLGDQSEISRIAWCTGGAQRYIETAHELGARAFISGEVSEQTTHFVTENYIVYYACGHHATERYGIKALGEHLAKQFKVDVSFIDIDNPV